jgi:phosphate-selective porin OprO/OprP
LEGTLYKQFDFKLMPDFGEGGRNIIQDAYIEARFTPALKLRAGKFKEPVGLERLASATDIAFVERALPTAIVPNRDIGLMLNGDLHQATVSYAIGVFNGVADGASADVDDQDGKDVAGRLFFSPFRGQAKHPLQGLGFGIAGSLGVQRGTFLLPNLPTYKTTGQLTFFRYRGDLTDAGSAVANGDHLRVSPQAYYYRGPIGVLAEHVISKQEVKRSTTNAATLTNTAWQVMGTWVLTGEKAGYKAPVPAHNFDSKANTWGALEIAARVHALDVDKDAFPVYANPSVAATRAFAWSFGLNWYLNPGFKIVNDYEQTTFTGGATTGNRPTEHTFLSRFQVSF